MEESKPPPPKKTIDADPLAAAREEHAEWILRSELTVRIPCYLRHFVGEQVRSGKYEDADQYVAALIKRDKEATG